MCSSPVLEEQWCSIRCGLDGLGIESRWGDEIFCTHPDRLWGPPSPQWVPCLFPWGKAARARYLPPTPM